MLKALIFDVDETLLDWRGRTQSWEDYQWDHLGRVFEYVNEYVHPLPDRELFYADVLAHVIDLWGNAKKTLIAPNLGDALITVLGQHGVPPDLLNVEECLIAYGSEPIVGVQPFPDVVGELTSFKRHGLRMGIVTNALEPMFMRDIHLEALGLLTFFDDGCRISAADVGLLKPHPKIFELILTCLNAAPDEAVFVGDSLRADVGGAQAIGMKAVLRENGENSQVESEIVPNGRIKTLSDLHPLLDEWFAGWNKQ